MGTFRKRLKKIYAFKNAQKIGVYYPIGSEIFTQDIIQEVDQPRKRGIPT